ncbi:DeoR/GlpR transcriptional regulator [Testudinibacter sp. TR-2022]|uniref:DeoR/GlpR family DNA-binding transcription regulator n=1 Tax=Testudinibacter sp. TR-2022 TaxID=2585029 RepID=UPI00111B8583|nr:DeoR/GlpR family DNA-binding transcription regulator [Testudinibacter sp. TR-2022]TNH03245.1 DeoR/GlpR transcriptional regulator [Pasteurellaceae bacterium Phil31]TNH10912.1 DeoR/GlpR transcriptional regulator [Testudinibacter sp. TR-2022]TNH12279.1 DeoR/GlpR transcriptional regulator [Testudinibacter sp. TR-2022]TNH15017.1 DeoR/GlpR transcriptional regulator [Testudinibacter sp. TR-2022]TNH20492.1 DeoR/GlpR transcriptional regulator [Testudinibacter sp. TR-2022]
MKERERFILEQINKLGKVDVNILALDLAVSLETIRRDLTKLDRKGLLHRTHGGAVGLKAKDVGHSFQARQKNNSDAKRLIAESAVEYVFEGAVIGLDASTTSWFFAQAMPDIPCTVVTNAMHNINALSAKSNIKTIATGGVYSAKYDAFYGPLSEQLLQRLHIDIGIFSCIGVDANGSVWESNELNASIKRKIMAASEQKFLLIDNSKLGRKSLMKICDLSQIDILFCDQLPNGELKRYCDQQNLLVITT